MKNERKKQGGKGNPAPAAGKPSPPALSVSFFNSVFSGRALWISLSLIAASVFIYAPAATHDFVTWDDPAYVSENPHVAAGLTWEGVRWAFTTGYEGNWHPLTWLSYMLDTQFFGLSAGPHLLANLVLHILNTLLLFGLLHKMTGALGRSAFVAALFAVHPLHVESVAWVSERKDVLSTLFLLATLWAYVDYTRQPGRIRYLTVLLTFALGLMAKPMLVTLPFVVLLLDYWPLRRVAQRRSVLQLVREKLPLLALAAVSSAVTFLVQQRAGALTLLTKAPLESRVANALVSYAAYIGKMLWPVRLSAFYPLRFWPPGVALGSGLALAAVSIAVIWKARRYPYLPVGWLWYLGTLVPVIGLVQVGSQSMADRYTYIPLIGLFLIMAWGIPDSIPRRRFREIMLPAAAGVAILGCAIGARAQVESWKDGMTLWTHVLEVNPDSDIAHNALGDELAKRGRTQEAMAQYFEALRINPDNAEAHNGLGMGLASEGKTDEAILQFSEVLRHHPDDTDTHNNLGVALVKEGRTNDAILQFSEVLRLNPDDPDAHNNLGTLLASQGRLGEAVTHFSAAVRLKPDFAIARENLKRALSKPATGTMPTR